MSCLYGSTLSLTCDVLTETTSQDANTGEFIRTWTASETVSCAINAVAAQGKDGASKEVFKNKRALYEEYVYILVVANISETSRISNIKDSNGVVLYPEPRTADPTVFEIIGKVPIVDGPFGQVSGYKLLCVRSDMQGDTNASA